MTIPEDERVEDPCSYMAYLAEAFLSLRRWGFVESYRSNEEGRLIYDSEWCRVKFVWGGWEMYSGNTISIYYGRLHASNDKVTIAYKGEECYCWHSLGGIAAVFDFLDGLTPQESVKRKGFSQIIEQLRQSELWQSLAGKRRDPELAIRMEAVVWENYGSHLFELFDLRHPTLWAQYRQFVTDVYDIKGRNPNIKPSPDKVC